MVTIETDYLEWQMKNILYESNTTTPSSNTVPTQPKLYQPQSEMSTLEGEIKFTFIHPAPNRWWRFWQFIFFGFKWRKIEGGQ